MEKAQTNPRGVMVAAMDSKSIPVLGCRFKSGRGYKRTGPIPGNLKQSDMKIYEVNATTGYTGFPLNTRGTVEAKGLPLIIEKAIREYGQKITSGPEYLSKFNLRIVIVEKISDGNGVFHIWATTYRDYKFENGGVAFIGEKTL